MSCQLIIYLIHGFLPLLLEMEIANDPAWVLRQPCFLVLILLSFMEEQLLLLDEQEPAWMVYLFAKC